MCPAFVSPDRVSQGRFLRPQKEKKERSVYSPFFARKCVLSQESAAAEIRFSSSILLLLLLLFRSHDGRQSLARGDKNPEIGEDGRKHASYFGRYDVHYCEQWGVHAVIYCLFLPLYDFYHFYNPKLLWTRQTRKNHTEKSNIYHPFRLYKWQTRNLCLITTAIPWQEGLSLWVFWMASKECCQKRVQIFIYRLRNGRPTNGISTG